MFFGFGAHLRAQGQQAAHFFQLGFQRGDAFVGVFQGFFAADQFFFQLAGPLFAGFAVGLAQLEHAFFIVLWRYFGAGVAGWGAGFAWVARWCGGGGVCATQHIIAPVFDLGAHGVQRVARRNAAHAVGGGHIQGGAGAQFVHVAGKRSAVIAVQADHHLFQRDICRLELGRDARQGFARFDGVLAAIAGQRAIIVRLARCGLGRRFAVGRLAGCRGRCGGCCRRGWRRRCTGSRLGLFCAHRRRRGRGLVAGLQQGGEFLERAGSAVVQFQQQEQERVADRLGALYAGYHLAIGFAHHVDANPLQDFGVIHLHLGKSGR